MDIEDTPRPELGPGSRFGAYELVRKLGEGGMGVVFEARRHGLNKRVALKVLTLVGGPGVGARFLREARISATLEHPHIADCIDVGEYQGMPYLALEFLDGETLGAWMDRGPVGVPAIVDVVLPVCSALAHAHANGVVHRDLKPDNVFLARKLGVTVTKVLDFGIAKAASGPEGPVTHTSAIMGTPAYMSPEQARESKHVTGASDQFSLGIILWEAVAGRQLFAGESSLEIMMKVVTETAAPLGTAARVEPAFEAVVTRLLARTPAERFPSMREAGAALLPFASQAARERWTPEFSAPAADLAGALQPTLPDADRPAGAPRQPNTTLSRSAGATESRSRRRARPASVALLGVLVVGGLAFTVHRTMSPPRVTPTSHPVAAAASPSPRAPEPVSPRVVAAPPPVVEPVVEPIAEVALLPPPTPPAARHERARPQAPRERARHSHRRHVD